MNKGFFMLIFVIMTSVLITASLVGSFALRIIFLDRVTASIEKIEKYAHDLSEESKKEMLQINSFGF